MKIVLDANIYISSTFWGGNPRAILQRCFDGIDDLYITEGIIDELYDVMSRPKFHLKKAEVDFYMNRINGTANKVYPKKDISISRDKDDNEYIECAVECNADYIISGDSDLLELKKYSNIKIVTARDYLNIVNFF
jgi:putative PIN family toxin of toxin-antitoxin system